MLGDKVFINTYRNILGNSVSTSIQFLLKDNNRISLTLTHTLNKMYALRISEISFPDTFRSLFGTRAFLLPFGPNSLSLRHGPRWQQLALSSRLSLHLPSGKLFLYPDSLYYQLTIYIFAIVSRHYHYLIYNVSRETS